jgi:aryl-alcohol dehydrogenase-like predicted oxidoreductase
MGIGTWAIGGPFTSGDGYHYPTGAPLGYGQADDAESIRALHCALDLGARLFDTADAYGTGHAERVLGRALEGRRQRVLIATKFGNTYDEDSKELTGTDVSPAYIRRACQASLKRLQTDWIDLYQLHVGDLSIDEAGAVADTLDGLCDEGLIRSYAWSTDDPERAAVFADRARAVAVQFDMNVFEDAPDMLEACDTHDFAGIVRQPLAMGFLSGKFAASGPLSGDDIRSRPPAWLRYFDAGGRAVPEWSERLNGIKEILTSGGRTLAQGALAWIWARSDRTIPIPASAPSPRFGRTWGPWSSGPSNPVK